MSGGTLASAITTIEDVPKALTAEAMKDFSYREREKVSRPFQSRNLPNNLATAKGAPTKPMKPIYSVRVDGKTWYGVMFPMCPINRLVVHHTWSLFSRFRDRRPDNLYGDNFTYDEIIATSRFYKAVFYLLGISAFIGSLLFPPVSLSAYGR